MENQNKIFLIILIIVILINIVSTIINIRYINKRENIKIIDTTYNTIVLDSIRYNIIERDSIIYHIKHYYEDSIENIKHLDDSSSVMLFEHLARERN